MLNGSLQMRACRLDLSQGGVSVQSLLNTVVNLELPGFLCSRSRVTEDCVLLGYETASLRSRVPTFRVQHSVLIFKGRIGEDKMLPSNFGMRYYPRMRGSPES
jgi:hypothetical protein